MHKLAVLLEAVPLYVVDAVRESLLCASLLCLINKPCTSWQQIFRFPWQVSFLLLIAVLPAAVAVLLSPLVREQPPGTGDTEPATETSTLVGLYGASLLLAALLLAAMLARVSHAPQRR